MNDLKFSLIAVRGPAQRNEIAVPYSGFILGLGEALGFLCLLSERGQR